MRRLPARSNSLATRKIINTTKYNNGDKTRVRERTRAIAIIIYWQENKARARKILRLQLILLQKTT